MPWWSVVYLLLFAALGVAGVVDDIRSGRPGYHLLSVAITAGIGCLLIVAFHVDRVGQGLGSGLLPLFLFAVFWEIYSAAADWRDLGAEGKLSAAQQRWALGMAALVTMPAYVLGALVILRRLSDS